MTHTHQKPLMDTHIWTAMAHLACEHNTLLDKNENHTQTHRELGTVARKCWLATPFPCN